MLCNVKDAMLTWQEIQIHKNLQKLKMNYRVNTWASIYDLIDRSELYPDEFLFFLFFISGNLQKPWMNGFKTIPC